MENSGILKWPTWSKSRKAVVAGALLGAIFAAAATIAVRKILLESHTAAQKVNPNEFGVDPSGAAWALLTFPATLICVLLHLTGNPFGAVRTAVALVINISAASLLGGALGKRLSNKSRSSKA